MRTATWNNVGMDVKGNKTIGEVLKASNLDYQVAKKNVYLGVDKRPKIENQYATVRSSDNHVYGIVGDGYQICQNEEAFDFVEYIDSDVNFVRAGETAWGMVYIIAELNEFKILGDKFKPYVIFQNGHTGGISIKTSISPLRMVCENQFSYVFKNVANAVTIRHSGDLEYKFENARQTLKLSNEYSKALDKKAEEMFQIKMPEDRCIKVMQNFFEITNDMSERKMNSIIAKRDDLVTRYFEEDNNNFKGTAWGLVNAYSDLVTHEEPARRSKNWEINKFTNVTFSNAVSSFSDYVVEVAV